MEQNALSIITALGIFAQITYLKPRKTPTDYKKLSSVLKRALKSRTG